MADFLFLLDKNNFKTTVIIIRVSMPPYIQHISMSVFITLS